MLCPLHNVSGGCACNDYPSERNVKRPAAMGLWVCDGGHRTVGGPTYLAGAASNCWCGLHLERVSVMIFRPREMFV